jgi:hypothetical protein
MFFDTPEKVETFHKQFTEVNGQYYYTLTDVDWLLPISEEKFSKQTEIFGVLTDVIMLLTWASSLACLAYILYNNVDLTLAWIFIPVFVLQFIANFASYILPNLGLSRRLMLLAKQDNDVKEKFLVMK